MVWPGKSTSVALGREFPFPQDFCGNPHGDPHREKSYSHSHPIPMGMGIYMGIPIPTASLESTHKKNKKRIEPLISELGTIL